MVYNKPQEVLTVLKAVIWDCTRLFMTAERGADAVITDVQIPEMDGIERICQIQSDKKYRRMAIPENSFWKRMLSLLAAFALLFSIVPVKAFASESTGSRGHEIVRVGYFLVDGFQEYDAETGIYSGYGYEFLMAISAYTDWQYEFVHCDTFLDAYAKLQNGEVDLLNDVSKVDGRDIEYTSLNSGDGCNYLLMHDGDNRVSYNDWEGIAGLTIGLDKKSALNDKFFALLDEHHAAPHIIWYENEYKMIEAWQADEVDAFVATSDMAIEGHAVMIFAPRMYYIVAQKGNTELIDEADFAIQALRSNAPDFEAILHDKYYSHRSINYSALTGEEQQYIKENPVIRVLYIPDWNPISYQDKNGEFAGPFRKIYALLEKETGLQFEFVPMDYDIPFEGIVDTYNCYMLAEHPADYTGAADYDVKLTQTFVNAALVEVTKGTLSQGGTIALVEGDCLSEVAMRLFGNDFEYVMEENIENCITKVQNGTVDGTILMSYEAEYYQSKRENRNLIYTAVNNGSYGFGLAVSNEADPLLYSIIVKGLNAIPDSEVSNIFNQMTQELQKPSLLDAVLDNPVPFAVGGIAFAAISVYAISGWYFSKKIKEKNDALIRANAATTQFFSRMSHDMRTPMNGILGIAELSKEDEDAAALHNDIDKIMQSGKYLLSLINDTLDFQRIETGNLKIEKEIVNCREVFRNIEELVAQSAKSKHIDFQITSDQNMPDCYVWADPVRVKQIFINLLSNAIKFTPEGGSVMVECECRRQDDTKMCDRFYVRDTGLGMSQEFIDTRMFKPFSQEHNEVTGQYAGSGLGLSIVKSLVELMGGTIRVESEVGTGSTFIIDLDFEKVSAEEVKQRSETQNASNDSLTSLSGKKILLAEDHPLNAEIAKKLLQKAGCEVTWAKNGQEAVSCFAEAPIHTFDVVLMDIRMPVMDGLEAARQIRALDKADAASIPIIAMTANAYEEDVKASLNAGMNAHLGKPIEPKILYETLARYLHKENENRL